MRQVHMWHKFWKIFTSRFVPCAYTVPYNYKKQIQQKLYFLYIETDKTKVIFVINSVLIKVLYQIKYVYPYEVLAGL